MNDSTTSRSPQISDVLRSNLLPTFVGWIRTAGASDSSLLGVEVFSLVLDANKVVAEIRWRLSKREKPDALSKIFESIEAKVLIAYVPSYLEHEIFANAEKVAVKIGKMREDVLEEWQRIKPFLRVHETAMQQVEVFELADPKDLVYMAAQQQLGVPAIYSSDRDLQRMGAPLVEGRIDDDLQSYARGMSITVGVNIGSGIVISVAVPNVFRALRASAQWLFDQPLPIQLVIAALLASLLRSPRVRSWISAKWNEYCPVLAELAMPILLEYCDSQQKANAARNRIREALPVARHHPTTLQYCLGSCPVSDESQSLSAILSGMREAGYRSKSKNPAPYVRRIMRESGLFLEGANCRWRRLPPPEQFDHSRQDSYAIRPKVGSTSRQPGSRA